MMNWGFSLRASCVSCLLLLFLFLFFLVSFFFFKLLQSLYIIRNVSLCGCTVLEVDHQRHATIETGSGCRSSHAYWLPQEKNMQSMQSNHLILLL